MENKGLNTHDFKRDELASMKLRRLFEKRGFRRVRVGKFEEYSLYIENKNFLQSEQIITFMDMDGRLLALKPDMTLSVVKNIPPDPLPCFQKLYYLDEVYRASREHREYRALNQIGVELVGPADEFAGLEILDLALSSLAAIVAEGENYVLDVSHLGFVAGLLEELHLSHPVEKRILAAIHSKSLHDISGLMDQRGEEEKNRVIALAALHGGIAKVLPEAEKLIVNDMMREAWDEMNTVSRTLGANGFGGHVNLDFSVVNNLDYYNGLIFKGYVENIPQDVLYGGRYDNLMRKMGKESGAIGFGVSLDELKIPRREGVRYDFDLLIRYSSGCDWSALLATVHRLTGEGFSVRLERDSFSLTNADFTCARLARFEQDKLLEEGEWRP